MGRVTNEVFAISCGNVYTRVWAHVLFVVLGGLVLYEYMFVCVSVWVCDIDRLIDR